MKDILSRGFKLSLLEWNFVFDFVVGTDEYLDSHVLGRIYRVAKLFRILGWTITEGLLLVQSLPYKVGMNGCSASLGEALGKSKNHAEVFNIIDRLSWLADWMSESDCSVEDVLRIMTPETSAQVASQDVVLFVEETKARLKEVVVIVSDLANISTNSEDLFFRLSQYCIIDDLGFIYEMTDDDHLMTKIKNLGYIEPVNLWTVRIQPIRKLYKVSCLTF